MRRAPFVLFAGLALGLAADSTASRPLPDYRYFRALAIDLLGRPPTRAEIADFEKPDFDVDHWLDAHLSGPRYSERLERIYADLLRLELPETTTFDPPAVRLHRVEIAGPTGPVPVYFRYGQRRADVATDGQLCFTQAETGITASAESTAQGTPHAITQALLDQRTVEVKPWWLYADYRDKAPKDHLSEDWARRFPGFEMFLPLFSNADKTPTLSVRVCKEEAQTAETGHILVTGRVVHKGMALPAGRLTLPPGDSAYATTHGGQSISCTSTTGFQTSAECGCGVGLERCLPGAPQGFVTPMQEPLGRADAFVSIPRPAAIWEQVWWAEEATHFMARIFAEDRDVRELVTSRATVINGPLAQFYRFLASATCCTTTSDLGYAEPEPLFDPAAVPKALRPEDAASWTVVADRGPHAAGLMTMPVFLIKYGTRRARAHVLSQAFLCKDFVAESVKLEPSTEPNLMKRPGCQACHRRLEPLAAYFSRVVESDWTYLPPTSFPISLERCAASGKLPGACRTYYDPAFARDGHSSLRGSYGSPAHADEGPPGFGQAIAEDPAFAPCVVRNVTESLIGRQLTSEDDGWRAGLTKTFVDGGYRMRPLVRAILTSPSYRDLDVVAPEAK